jgi:tripartite-type tricarboxylate transporter receptor subunit TctC
MSNHQVNTTRRALVAGLAAAPLLASAQSAASSYPNKPIRFIVPFPAGSAPDAIARIMTQHMTTTLGQPFVIDNKPGAQGSIAAAEAARAAPDGYTIFGGNNSTLAGNLALYKKLTYDPNKDFTPIGRFITAGLMLVVRPDSPAKTTKELVARAKANPGKLTAAHASAGMQVALGEFKGLGGVDVLEVSYKGVPQAVSDLLGGQIDFTFADYAAAFPQVRSGKLRGLGVTAPTRTQLMPDMPSLAEDLPGFDVTVWSGLVAPAGTSKDVVDKLWDASRKALAAPEVAQRLNAIGLEVAPIGPQDFPRFLAAEQAKWARQVKAANIQAE